MTGLQRMLSGVGSGPVEVPTVAVVELLAATFSAKVSALQDLVVKIGAEAESGKVGVDGFARLLQALSSSVALSAGNFVALPDMKVQRARTDLAMLRHLKVRLRWLSRWLLLRLSGALGAGLRLSSVGATIVFLMSGGAALLPLLLALAVGFLVGAWSGRLTAVGPAAVTVVGALWLRYCVRYGQRVARWVRCAAGLGLLVGWHRGPIVLEPEQHSIRGVFCSGLRGELLLAPQTQTSSHFHRINIFACD